MMTLIERIWTERDTNKAIKETERKKEIYEKEKQRTEINEQPKTQHEIEFCFKWP